MVHLVAQGRKTMAERSVCLGGMDPCREKGVELALRSAQLVQRAGRAESDLVVAGG